MARAERETDYTVKVENVGTFRFGKRTMRDEVSIQVEYARIIDGVEPTEWLAIVAGWLSTLQVLTVSAPEGWDLNEFDPLDSETYATIKRVYDALLEKERSFRRKPEIRSEGSGAQAV